MSYTYRKDSFGDEDNKFHLLLTPAGQKAGLFTIPLVTGAFSVTGVGFQPDVVIIIGGQGEAIGASSGNYAGRLSLGCATSDGDQQWATSIAGGYLGNPPDRVKTWRPGYCVSVCDRKVTEALRASLVSFDADGFTLDFDIVGPWRGHPMTQLAYLCLTGDFHAGVHELGSDISSAPFQPKGIWAVSARETESILTGTHGYQIAQGFGDARGNQVCWTGAALWDDGSNTPPSEVSTTGIRSTSYFDTEHLLALIRPSNDKFNAASVDVAVIGQATLNSFTGDGVSLIWDLVDGVKQHHEIGHLLFGMDAEAGHFIYPANSTDNSPLVLYRDVASRLEPTAMLSGAFGPRYDHLAGYENFETGMNVNFGFGAKPPGGWLDRGDPGDPEEFFVNFAESGGGFGTGDGFQLTVSILNTFKQMGTWAHVDEPGGLIEQQINVVQTFAQPRIVDMMWREARRQQSRWRTPAKGSTAG